MGAGIRRDGKPGRSRASVGAYGQRSSKRNPYAIKERVRGQDKRVTGALAQIRESEEALAARMAAEEAATAHLVQKSCTEQGKPVKVTDPEAVQQVATLLRVAEQPRVVDPEPDTAKQANWTLGDARQLVRDGYSVRQAIRMTGYPRAMLED